MFKGRISKFSLGAAPVIVGALLAFVSCNDNNPITSPATNPSSGPGLVNAQIVANAVGMGANAYAPNPLEVAQGQTVAWTNMDTVAHTVTANDGSFDSGDIAPAGVYKHTFTDVGTFDYFDTIYGSASMNGVVVVNPSPSPSPSESAEPSPSPSPSVSVSPSPSPSVSPSPMI